MDIVDRELEQFPQPDRPTCSASPSSQIHNRFALMVGLSLFFHLIAAGVVLSPRTSSVSAPAVNFIDLSEVKLPAEVPALPAETTDQPEPAETIPEPPPADPPQPATEMDKLQAEVRQSLQNAETDPELLSQRSFGIGLTSGYFTSIAQGESLRGEIREYYFAMLRQINEKWWLTQEAQTEDLREVVINVVIARDGTVVEMAILVGSGNRRLDRAMLATIEAASPLPPLPANFNMEVFSAPLRFMKPLNLFQSLAS